jgi:hypothetical protein
MAHRIRAIHDIDVLSSEERELLASALEDDPKFGALRERRLVVYELESDAVATVSGRIPREGMDGLDISTTVPPATRCVAPFSADVKVGVSVTGGGGAQAIREDVVVERGQVRRTPQLHVAIELICDQPS